MPTKPKKEATSGRPRAPEGKKQMLVLMDKQVIKDVKVAALDADWRKRAGSKSSG